MMVVIGITGMMVVIAIATGMMTFFLVGKIFYTDQSSTLTSGKCFWKNPSFVARTAS